MMNSRKPFHKIDEQISLILREKNEYGHRNAINCVSMNPVHYRHNEENQERILTGSRDRMIYEWDVNSTKDNARHRMINAYDEHFDWVNDLLVLKKHDKFVSCSNDGTTKIWNLDTSQQISSTPQWHTSIHSFDFHTDYVKCLGYHSLTDKLFSGSLDGRLIISDLNKWLPAQEIDLKKEISPKKSSNRAILTDCPYKRFNSIYSMSVSQTHSPLIGLSFSDSNVSILDLREKHSPIATLTGHEDMVRAVKISKDGTICLTASSDKSIRLWDLGQQRCVQTYHFHKDSSSVSGGKNGKVFLHNIIPNTTFELYNEDKGILSLCLNSTKTRLWMSFPSTSLLKNISIPKMLMKEEKRIRGEEETKSRSSQKFKNISASLSWCKSPGKIKKHKELYKQQALELTIRGLPFITKFAILTNKRYILTQNNTGTIHLWHLLNGKCVKSFKEGDFKEFETMFNKLDADKNPTWCKVDIKLGSLTLYVNNSDGFAAQISNSENKIDDFLQGQINTSPVKIETSPQDQINLGKVLLGHIFYKYLKNRYKMESEDLRLCIGEEVYEEIKEMEKKALRNIDERNLKNYFFLITENSKQICNSYSSQINFNQLNSYLPRWITHTIFQSPIKYEFRKISFDIMPFEDENTSHFKGSFKLTAAPDCNFTKVAEYVFKGLKLQPKGKSIPISQIIEILIHDEVRHPKTTLEMASRFLWKGSSVLVVQYRIKTLDLLVLPS